MCSAEAIDKTPGSGYLAAARTLAPGAVLALIVAILYWRTSDYGFFHIDDESYLIDSGLAAGGSFLEALKSVFGQHKGEYWFPLTFLSYLIDSSVFGTGPGVFHRTNTILFAANAFLAYLFLLKATGSPVKSILAASLFALHPMRVESVAWIAERKDLLSGVFFFLTMIYYIEWAKGGGRSKYFYALAFMVAGMMAKAILMVAPLLMLVLDFWPLERLKNNSKGDYRSLFVEKTPFLAVAIFFAALNAYLTRSAFAPTSDASVIDRILSLGVVYLHYLSNTFYPFGLTFTLLDPTAASTATKASALAAFAALTAGCLYAGKREKSVAAGWLWWLIALLPASGLAKGAVGGIQAVADRFTFLPHIGLAVALVWGGGRLADEWPKWRTALLAAACAAMAALGLASHLHLPNWADTGAVGRHLLKTGGEASFGHYLVAESEYRSGRDADAMLELEKASAAMPVYREVWFLRGLLLAKKGEYRQAEESFNKLLAVDPAATDAHYQLGLIAAVTGNPAKARDEFQKELVRSENHLDALYNLGVVATFSGELGLAEESYRRALSVWPEDPLSNYNLGIILTASGRTGEAKTRFSASLAADPANRAAEAWLSSIRSGGGAPLADLPGPAALATRRDDKL